MGKIHWGSLVIGAVLGIVLASFLAMRKRAATA